MDKESQRAILRISAVASNNKVVMSQSFETRAEFALSWTVRYNNMMAKSLKARAESLKKDSLPSSFRFFPRPWRQLIEIIYLPKGMSSTRVPERPVPAANDAQFNSAA